MKINRTKIFAIIVFAFPFVFVTLFSIKPVIVRAVGVDDPAAVYRAKCALCHTPKAEKFFDPTKSEDVHVAAIMKGRKGAKPPYMPEFETKGMTEAEAKGLTAYMKGLRPPQ